MRWIIKSSLKFRFVLLALSMGLMFFGARQLDDMPVDVFPEFAPPLVEIQTPLRTIFRQRCRQSRPGRPRLSRPE